MTSISSAAGSAVSAPADRRELAILQFAVTFFIGLRLVYGVFVPPNGDEAYYWLWGGHLQLSYYDHSPMVGWTSAIGRALLGWTPAGLHLPAFITFLVLALSLYRAARWLAPGDSERYFWTVLAIFCASPLFNALTTLNYPDHLLICFGALALLYLGRYLNAALDGLERQPDLYLGAAFLGLAGLSKYNAAFIPAGLLIVLIAAPRLRRLFWSVHLYVAGALCLAILSPVFIWNATHEMATLGLHASERMEDRADLFTPIELVRVVAISALTLSPFLVAGFCRFLFGRSAEPRQAGLILLGRGTVFASTLFLLPLAAWGAYSKQVSPHWLVLSFLPFMLVAPLYLRSRLMLWLHLGWGAIVNTLLVVYYLLPPLPTTLLGIGDAEAARTFGQDQLAAAVSAAVTEHGADLVVSRNYTAAAKLAFGLGSDSMISDGGGRVDRLTGRDLAGYDGRTMILVDPSRGLTEQFERVEPVGEVTPQRFDLPLATYGLQAGTGFSGAQ